MLRLAGKKLDHDPDFVAPTKKSVSESASDKPAPEPQPATDIAKARDPPADDNNRQSSADVLVIPGLDDLPLLSPLMLIDFEQSWDLKREEEGNGNAQVSGANSTKSTP